MGRKKLAGVDFRGRAVAGHCPGGREVLAKDVLVARRVRTRLQYVWSCGGWKCGKARVAPTVSAHLSPRPQASQRGAPGDAGAGRGGGGSGSSHSRSVKAHTLSRYGLAHLSGRVTGLGVEESAGVVVYFHPAIQLKLE